MRERTFSHLVLTLTMSLGFYLVLSPPYGITFERIGGIFLVIFMLWADWKNYKNQIKEIKQGEKQK